MRVGREARVYSGWATRVGGGDHIDINKSEFIQTNGDIHCIDEPRSSRVWKDLGHITVPFVGDDGDRSTHPVEILAAGASFDIRCRKLNDPAVGQDLVEDWEVTV